MADNVKNIRNERPFDGVGLRLSNLQTLWLPRCEMNKKPGNWQKWENITHLEQKVTMYRWWQTGHGSVLLHLGEKAGYYLHGNWHQGASSVTRETSSWGREQACNYALKLRGSRDWPSRACTESKRAAILNGLTIQAEIGWMPESRMTSSSQIAIFFFKPGVQVTFLNKERIRYKEPTLLNGGAVEDSWESLGLQGDQTSRS